MKARHVLLAKKRTKDPHIVQHNSAFSAYVRSLPVSTRTDFSASSRRHLEG